MHHLQSAVPFSTFNFCNWLFGNIQDSIADTPDRTHSTGTPKNSHVILQISLSGVNSGRIIGPTFF
jgi:hypothetical protein